MAVTVVASAKNGGFVAGNTGVSVTHGFTLQNGDYVVAFISKGDDTGTGDRFTSSSGGTWTAALGAALATTTGNDMATNVLYRKVTNAAGEPSSYTFTVVGTTESRAMNVIVVQVRGADGTNFLDTTSTTNTGTNDFTPTHVNITTTQAGCLVLMFHAGSLTDGTATGKTGGAPAYADALIDYRGAADSATVGFDSFIEVAYKANAPSGTQTIAAWTGTADDSSSEWHVVTLAVAPPAATTVPGSFTANAVIKKTQTPTGFTADAIELKTQTGVFYIGNNDGTGGAVIEIQKTTYTFTDKKADAVILATIPGSLSADAVLFASSGTKTTTADAVKLESFTGTPFTLDAAIHKFWEKTLSIDAVIFANSGTKTLTADAVTFTSSGTKTLPADAVIQSIETGSLSADAIVLRGQAESFASDAIVRQTQSGSLSAAAIIGREQAVFLLADAISLRTQSLSFLIGDAVEPGGAWLVTEPITGPVWVSPADGSSIGSNPVLVFTSPATSKNQHFHIQLDKVATFDGPDLREIKSNFDLEGWEYWDGGTWVAMLAIGLPVAHAGNDVRYSVVTPLSTGTWYRRVRAG